MPEQAEHTETETRDWRDARVLIVDDRGSTVWELVRVLDEAGFEHVQSTTNPDEALYFCDRYHPDLLILDLHLEDPTSPEILGELDGPNLDAPPPHVIGLLEAGTSGEVRREAAELGVRDFLERPVEAATVQLRVENCLKRRFWDELGKNGEGPILVSEGVEGAEEQAELDLLQMLARLIEFRDFETATRGERVGHLSAKIARQLGLSSRKAHLLREAAPLHDIGMVVVPDRILLKRGELTGEEREVVKTHADNGARILGTAQLPVLQLASRVARTHHERWDGGGYPDGLEGEEIPLVGRVVAVADAYAAMTHDRPYREARDPEAALDEIREGRGTQFDPQVVDALLELDAAGSLPPEGDG